MEQVKKIELIKELIERTEELHFNDEVELNAILQESKMIVKRIFGNDSDYIQSINTVFFHPLVFPVETEYKMEVWYEGKSTLINTFKTMKRDLELSTDNTEQIIDEATNESLSKVFIVHGHDEAMKLNVARVIDKLGLKPIILSEQDDEGLTVIEKFEKHAADCNYAVVLLSPDDLGSKRSEQEKKQFRARQNVILELGYFVGVLGRKHVLTLVKDDAAGQLEIPSDFAGVVYTQYDKSEGWKLKLVKGLKACGYNVSADNL